MCSAEADLFAPLKLRRLTLPNRLIRSATFEGMADADGVPDVDELGRLYAALAEGGVGTIVTGFCFVSRQGRAMQTGQAGMDRDALIEPWSRIVRKVREASPETRIILQLAHTGRQTRSAATGEPVVGPSRVRCSYHGGRVTPLSDAQIKKIIHDFAQAALRASEAGFDGVQIHAAHGYLIHQFLSPHTNRRKDRWGERNRFLLEVLEETSRVCGVNYPILLKLSHADDAGLTLAYAISTARRAQGFVDAIEISYGTMEQALNIFRGGCPIDLILRVNPRYRRIPGFIQKLWKRFRLPRHLAKLKPFEEAYNLEAARAIGAEIDVPIIPVGGFRTLERIRETIRHPDTPALALCRPFIREPDLVRRIRAGEWTESACTNCNACAVYCDTDQPLACHSKGVLELVWH